MKIFSSVEQEKEKRGETREADESGREKEKRERRKRESCQSREWREDGKFWRQLRQFDGQNGVSQYLKHFRQNVSKIFFFFN